MWHVAREQRLSKKLEEAKQTAVRIEDELRKANVLSNAAKEFAESTKASPPAPSPVLSPHTMSELPDDFFSDRIE